VDWDGLEEMSLRAPQDPDRWFMAFEARVKAARVPEAEWAPRLASCLKFPAAFKEKFVVQLERSYGELRTAGLRANGPRYPVSY
jgi:hypothetical protein